MATYKMTIAGLERELPICKVNDKLDIAGFVIFGDVEMTVASAAELLKKCPEFDFIVAPEAKAIPLAHEMARQSGKPYFICRKGAKLYMQSPVSVNVRSITTDKEQTLFMDSLEGEQLRGKRVVILDDVISTGESLLAVRKLLEQFDADIVAQAAILAEGDAADRDDIVYLEKLPLFFHD
jgi:adenine phosphoribosyltransferase